MAETFPMTGGTGLYSYTNNSTKQKEGAEAAKSMLLEGIIENLEIEHNPSKLFTVADLGCSTGPNTFISINNIIGGVIHTYKTKTKTKGYNDNLLPEFQVYFNDHVSNDFNTLFANFPSDRKYFGYGVPGSFYGRLFPSSFLNFAYSAFALHWLSRAPPGLSDLSSGICNRGRIHYANAPSAVCEAYFAQYRLDMESFLSGRAEEIVPGGLMALLIPGRPNGTLPSEFSLGQLFLPLESCLVDMANEGILSWDKVDSFNLPMYNPSIEELTTLIQKNDQFTIAKLEKIPAESAIPIPNPGETRSGFETILKAHFGNELTEELFERYEVKFAEHYSKRTADPFAIGLFILLKRRH